MACNRTQELLSAYLDGMVSEEERESVEKHLSSCGECSQALSELAQSVHYIREIEDVEPPPWLKQNVMEKVYGAPGKKSIWKKLFYPLHVKLPLEAAGAALLAVITLYVFQSVQPVVRSGRVGDVTQIPYEQTGRPPGEIDQALSADIRNATVPETPESTVPMSRMLEAEEEVKSEYKVKEIPTEPMKEELSSGKRKMIKGYVQEDKVDALKPARESTVMTKSAEAPARSKDTGGMTTFDEGVVESMAERDVFTSEMRPRPASGKVARDGIVVRVLDMIRSSREIKRIIVSLEGEVLDSELFDDRSIIIANVSEEHFSKFIDELLKVGSLRDEIDVDALKEGYVDRITIILEPL